MSDPASTPAAPLAGPAVQSASPWQMYRALVGIGLLCGLLIVTVYQVTAPIIERNRAEALEQAIFDVLPDARSSQAFALGSDGRFTILGAERADVSSDRTVYAAYSEDGGLVGLAIEAQGMGYQDIIRVLYGYSFDDQAIVGLKVLDSRETPGLGDKIEKDERFLANFVKLDVSLATESDDGLGIAHPIEAVKPGEKTSPWQIDTITGATISSDAIAEILRNSSSQWMPRVHPRQGDFAAPDSAATREVPDGQ